MTNPENRHHHYGPQPPTQPFYGHHPTAQHPYGQPPYGQQPYGQPPHDRKPSSWLPTVIAAVIVLILAIGVTAYLVLRDTEQTAAAERDDSPQSVGAQAEAVMAEFVQAFDEQDKPALASYSRGILLEHVEEFGDNPGGYELAGSLYDDTEVAEVEHGQIAIVYWEFEFDGEAGVFTALMFAEDGSSAGFQVCNAWADPATDIYETSIEWWTKHYVEDCQVDA